MMWMRTLILVSCVAVVEGGLLQIRVDDEVKIYIDGKVDYNEFTIRRWQWEELAEIPFDDDAEILASKMYNQGPRRLGYGKGLIDGNDLFSSGIVCKDVPKKQDPDAFFPGWFEADYDDSDWTPPVAVESHPTEGVLADAHGFWGQRMSSKNVLCRLKLTRAPIDECPKRTCGCYYRCENLGGTFSCSCTDGFELDDVGKTCNARKDCENVTRLDNGTDEVYVKPYPQGAVCRVLMSLLEQDSPSYTLSVDVHPENENRYSFSIMYNFQDMENFDTVWFDLHEGGYCHFSFTSWTCPHYNFLSGYMYCGGATKGWFTVAVVVAPHADIPQVHINGKNFTDPDAVNDKVMRYPRRAAGGVELTNYATRHLLFRNFQITPISAGTGE